MALPKPSVIIIAIPVAALIAAPAYYFLVANNNPVHSLPLIKATSATTEYKWTGGFSNQSVAWFFLNQSVCSKIYGNLTMQQQSFPASHIYAHMEAGFFQETYTLSVVINITGIMYLNPNPSTLTMVFTEDLLGASANYSAIQYNNTTTAKDTLGLTQLNLHNGSGLQPDHAYNFCIRWVGTTQIYFPFEYNTSCFFEMKITVGGLYVPVTSTFLVNFTDVKS